MTAKKPKEHVIKGGVIFKKVSPLAVYFELEREKSFFGNRSFTVDRDAFPADFNPEIHEVSGEFSIKIVVSEK
jgi:hypothetical protein